MPHETYEITAPAVDACGTVGSVEAAHMFGIARITSIGGIPPGPTFSVRTVDLDAQGELTSGTLSTIQYAGRLTRGNEFGQCEASAAGTYERIVRYEHPGVPGGNSGCLPGLSQFLGLLFALFRPSRPVKESGTFRATVKLNINPPAPPQFTPAAVQVPRGTPGPAMDVRVKVTPPCTYDIVFSHNDELPRHLIIQPTMLTTAPNGEATVQVRDAIDQPRGPIIVTGTIHARTPCQGSPVAGSFAVTVT